MGVGSSVVLRSSQADDRPGDNQFVELPVSSSAPAVRVDEFTIEEQGNLSALLTSLLPRSVETFAQSSVNPTVDSVSPLLRHTDPGLARVLSVVGEDSRTWTERQTSFRPRVQTLAAGKQAPGDASFASTNSTDGPVANLPPLYSNTELEMLECVICANTLYRPVYTPCHHAFCSECITGWLERSSDCPLCRRHVRASQLKLLTGAKKERGYIRKLRDAYLRLRVECPRCLQMCVMMQWEKTCGREACLPRRRSQMLLSESGTTDDGLVTWLCASKPGILVKLYVVTHRMQNDAGAIGGLVLPGLKHEQAVLEFDDGSGVETDEHLMWETRNGPTSGLSHGVKLFLSMEIFANRAGVVWSVSSNMPDLRSTAERLLVWTAASTVENVVDFVCQNRHKTYNLVTWNCQTYIRTLREHLGIQREPEHVLELQTPSSEAPELLRILRTVARSGKLPNSAGGDASGVSTRVGSSSDNIIVTRVAQIQVGLFDPEDLHRRGLHGVTLLRRPFTSGSSARQEWLRYHTMPVLVFRLQSRREFTWTDICWVSAEMRSDQGLLWHNYVERPSGLDSAVACAGVYTDCTVESLITAIQEIQHRRYDPRHWSGWEWANAIADRCAPNLFETLWMQFS